MCQKSRVRFSAEAKTSLCDDPCFVGSNPSSGTSPSSGLPRWPHSLPMPYPNYGFQGDLSFAMPRPGQPFLPVFKTLQVLVLALQNHQIQSMLKLKQSLSSQFESVALGILALEN